MYQKKFQFDGTHYYTGEPIPMLGAGKKTDKEAMRSAFKGKQFLTAHPKSVAAAQEGLFTKHTHANELYDDTSATRKDNPDDKKKLGFYSRSAARGLGARTVDMERYREHVKTEFKHIDAKLEATHEELKASGELDKGATAVLAGTGTRVHTKFEREGRDVKEGRPATMYDYTHTDMTRADWQKTSRDVWYHDKARPAEERKRTGAFSTAADDYGYGIDGIEAPPEHGKKSAWKDFLDKGHREANLARF